MILYLKLWRTLQLKPMRNVAVVTLKWKLVPMKMDWCIKWLLMMTKFKYATDNRTFSVVTNNLIIIFKVESDYTRNRRRIVVWRWVTLMTCTFHSHFLQPDLNYDQIPRFSCLSQPQTESIGLSLFVFAHSVNTSAIHCQFYGSLDFILTFDRISPTDEL